MNINQYIFREYDVRGKVEDDFPPEVVESLGKAFGTFIKRGGGQEIALSGDIRLPTPDLIEHFNLTTPFPSFIISFTSTLIAILH